MVEPPTGFHGSTGVGALTGISAVGLQDTFLYSKEESPTSHTHKSFTQTTPCYRYYKPIQTKFLGQEIRHVFKPQEMGDLLTALMLKFRLPSSVEPVSCLYNLGVSMIERIDLIVGDELIQSLEGDWMSMYESMHSTNQTRTNTLNLMFNLGREYNQQKTLIPNDTTQVLFFPIPFFFNSHYTDNNVNTKSFKTPLPLCALKTEITIVIKFLPFENIVSDITQFNPDADITDFLFITEEIILTNQERLAIMTIPQIYPIEKIITEKDQLPISLDRSYRYYLNSLYSFRAIFWNFKYEQGNSFNPEYYSPIKKARIDTLGKTNRNEFQNPLFFQEFQSYIHDYNNHGTFYGYSFSEQPLTVISGDYEYKPPRPQSAFLEFTYSAAPVGYTLWSEFFSQGGQNFNLNYNNIFLDTSVNSILSFNSGQYSNFMTDIARVGIPTTSYSDTTNLSDPYIMRFEPWTGGGNIKISSTSYVNINSDTLGFPLSPSSSITMKIFYLTIVKCLFKDGSASII